MGRIRGSYERAIVPVSRLVRTLSAFAGGGLVGLGVALVLGRRRWQWLERMDARVAKRRPDTV
jgi:hypothetical protein